MSRSRTQLPAGRAPAVEAADPRRDNGDGKRAKSLWKRDRDWAGIFARVLCVLFAIVGIVPLAVGGLARFDSFQHWAAEKTTRLLAEQLSVTATYHLELSPWPLEIAMTNVVVAASDGGSPFLEARRIVARPRIFSLLAGKPDLGEVEIEDARVRAVVHGGKLTNLEFELPDSDESKSDDGPKDLPLSAISLTNALVDVTIDQTRVVSDEIDLDITVGRMPGDKKPLLPIGLIEISLRAGRTDIDRRHAVFDNVEVDALDEDIICDIDVRARIADGVVVRRLDIVGALDFSPDADTRPTCELAENDWRRVAISIEGGELRLGLDGELDGLDGRIQARVPAAIANRFADLPPMTGWVAVDLEDAHFDNTLRIPNAKGKIEGADLSIDTRTVATSLKADVSIDSDVLHVSNMDAGWAGGMAHFTSVTLAPFEDGMKLLAEDIAINDISVQDVLDDLATHPHSHVSWAIDKVTFDRFEGTLMPLDLAGLLVAETRNFGVYDKPHEDRSRRTLMGLSSATISGNFRVLQDATIFSQMTVRAPNSLVKATVSIGYEEQLGVNVFEGTTIDLNDVSPLVDIPIEGIVKLTVEGGGSFDDPRLEGVVEVDKLVFGGFPLGDIRYSKVEFVPLELRFTEAKVHTGASDLDVPMLNISFDDADADVLLDGTFDTNSSGMYMHDLFRMVNLLPPQDRAEGAMPKLDPTWEKLNAKAFGSATVHYVLGGRRDRCAGGKLEVKTRMRMTDVELWDISYEDGDIDLDWSWDDLDAGAQGLSVNVHSGVLRKGSGTIVANAQIRPGAKIRADIVATAVPVGEFKMFRNVFNLSDKESDDDALRRIRPEAAISFVAEIGGTLDQLLGHADVDLSSMRIGPDLLPSSRFHMDIVPNGEKRRRVRVTKCGNDVTEPFEAKRWVSDLSDGIFKFDGQLFDGQIKFNDFQLTQQRSQMVSGQLSLRKLDLGALANLLPDVAFSAKPPRGTLTAEVHVDELPIDEPGLAEIRMFVQKADLKRGDTRLHIGAVEEPVVLSGDALRIPSMPIDLRFSSGLNAKMVVGGSIGQLSTKPLLALSGQLDPIDLSTIGVDIPQVKRASGVVRASLEVNGPLDAPQLGGRLVLDDGMLRIKGLPLALDDIDLDVRVRQGEVNIRRATARVGNNGRLSLNGRLPLKGVDIVGADATLVVNDVKVPVADGVALTADARLHATYDGSEGALPNITGRVTLKNFSYTRPMAFRVDLDSLTGGGVTEVNTYKPEDDSFNFDVTVVSPQPVRIANNLLDMRLDVTPPGIRVSGTDQRFGARGQLRIAPGSKLYLQGHDFLVRDGTVDFDNPTRIAPKLDVHATTQYRRYAANVDAEATTSTADVAAGSSASGGRWRIAIHAYGDTDAPEVRFSSDPPLSQEDIVLLLTVGMTRAELDRNLSGALAQTVGLEALNAVTGLDQALRKSVPVIDEFRVGTQYSSRTGRPEPAVTLGKRLSDDVRATVTTGLSESREVRSNIEWRLKHGVSVQGSYDNVNEVSSSALGNVGAGLRWRLEFE